METLDPALVVLTVGGNTITGYADGTFINVTWDEDTFTPYTGAAGEPARVRNRNGTATLEVTLMQTSRGNDVMSAMFNLDRQAGTPPGVTQVAEINGTTVIVSDDSYIAKYANVEYSKEMSARVWKIIMPRASGVIGGTNPTVAA